jgi:hypothetical protein
MHIKYLKNLFLHSSNESCGHDWCPEKWRKENLFYKLKYKYIHIYDAFSYPANQIRLIIY